MKVFWSWQSDHPGRVSRFFVRDALKEAIAAINAENEVEEPEREVKLDQDRQGVPGSPDLAATILAKIDASAAFVADVTPVGKTSDGKSLINSNVAIELGYALKSVGDAVVLMVLNQAFGTRDDLPFDLQHKAGPIVYKLEPGASKEDVERAKKALVGSLRSQLRDILNSGASSEAPSFKEIESQKDNPGRYFPLEEVLAERRQGDYRFASDRLFYVRVIPTGAQPELRRVEALEVVRANQLRVPHHRASGWSSAQNKYGVIVFDVEHEIGITSATQLFRNRELWGIDSDCLDCGQFPEAKGIPCGVHERMIASCLYNYLQFSVGSLGVDPPFTVELGVVGAAGQLLFVSNSFLDQWGPILDDRIIVRETLKTIDPVDVDALLLRFFEAIFDAAGHERPQRFNNFPGEQSGDLPGS